MAENAQPSAAPENINHIDTADLGGNVDEILQTARQTLIAAESIEPGEARTQIETTVMDLVEKVSQVKSLTQEQLDAAVNEYQAGVDRFKELYNVDGMEHRTEVDPGEWVQSYSGVSMRGSVVERDGGFALRRELDFPDELMISDSLQTFTTLDEAQPHLQTFRDLGQDGLNLAEGVQPMVVDSDGRPVSLVHTGDWVNAGQHTYLRGSVIERDGEFVLRREVDAEGLTASESLQTFTTLAEAQPHLAEFRDNGQRGLDSAMADREAMIAEAQRANAIEADHNYRAAHPELVDSERVIVEEASGRLVIDDPEQAQEIDRQLTELAGETARSREEFNAAIGERYPDMPNRTRDELARDYEYFRQAWDDMHAEMERANAVEADHSYRAAHPELVDSERVIVEEASGRLVIDDPEQAQEIDRQLTELAGETARSREEFNAALGERYPDMPDRTRDELARDYEYFRQAWDDMKDRDLSEGVEDREAMIAEGQRDQDLDSATTAMQQIHRDEQELRANRGEVTIPVITGDGERLEMTEAQIREAAARDPDLRLESPDDEADLVPTDENIAALRGYHQQQRRSNEIDYDAVGDPDYLGAQAEAQFNRGRDQEDDYMPISLSQKEIEEIEQEGREAEARGEPVNHARADDTSKAMAVLEALRTSYADGQGARFNSEAEANSAIAEVDNAYGRGAWDRLRAGDTADLIGDFRSQGQRFQVVSAVQIANANASRDFSHNMGGMERQESESMIVSEIDAESAALMMKMVQNAKEDLTYIRENINHLPDNERSRVTDAYRQVVTEAANEVQQDQQAERRQAGNTFEL